MPNASKLSAVSAVTLEHGGYTYLALFSPGPHELMELSDDEQSAYCSGRLIPSARPVRPVRCYEGARS